MPRSWNLSFALLVTSAAGLACAPADDVTVTDTARPDDAEADGTGDADPEDGDARDDGGPQSCTGPADCAGGPCSDGWCCDEECRGTCRACNLPGREGTCSPIPAGQDPGAECLEQSPETCGLDGTCDGAGACARYASGTPCDDRQGCTTDDECDGAGECTGATPTDCAPEAGNECCTGDCSGLLGCYTEAQECPDGCAADRLTVGRTCVGCGPARAAGICSGGTSQACTAADHVLCAELDCGGTTWRCTNVGGLWAWRTGVVCDDGDPCTSSDACFGGTCGGTGYSCVSDDCTLRTCDGVGGCDEDYPGSETACGATACPPDTCAGITRIDFPESCANVCDGRGACTTCSCDDNPSDCGVGPANECCAAACADASGCYTVPGSCGGADVCTDPYLLNVARVCTGCGPAAGSGACGGGGTFRCDAATHDACRSVTCGGTVYYCTNAGGTWRWRASAACDDGNPCSYGDTCGAGGCTGTTVDCVADACMLRACNGTATCTETPRPAGTACGSASCLADYCSGGSHYDFPATCASSCDGTGSCTPCACTPVTTGCGVGSGNECCAAACTAGAGCATTAAACPDLCADPARLTTGRDCSGCGPNGAAGACGGGTTHPCGTGELCRTQGCGGDTYYCTNQGGSVRWRAGDARCDDGDACTYNDSCSGTACTGAVVSCTSTPPCITRSCNGSAACTVTYNAGAACDDGSSCTTGETCNAAGACTGGSSTAVCGDTLCNCGETAASCPGDCGTPCPSSLTLATWTGGAESWAADAPWRHNTSGYMVAGSTSSYCSGTHNRNLTSPTDVDLSGCSSALLTFSVRLDDDVDWTSESSTDLNQRLYVECSGDGGGAWTSLTPSPWPANQSACATSYCDGNQSTNRSFGWTAQTITLPAACRTARFRVRYRINGSCIWDLENPGWFVDTVRVN
jgi:hypothetical protein